MSDYRTAEPIRMYIFGNSISWHEAIEGTLWQRTCGMAASAPERDWVHLIIEMLQERTQRKFLTEVSNAADFFERNFRAFSPEKFADALQAISADIILFQLGDNVNFFASDDKEVFVRNYTNFVNALRRENRLLLMTSPFYPYRRQEEATREVALNTGIFYANIAHLQLLDQRNLAIDQYQHHEFIEQHPSDRGMQGIAESVFAVLYPAYQLMFGQHDAQ